MMELHGDMIEHGQPVMTIFHRPRDEASLLEEQGFDPKAASFQFVDISSPDLGPWMQQLINNEKWLRNTVSVMLLYALLNNIQNPSLRHDIVGLIRISWAMLSLDASSRLRVIYFQNV